MVDVSPFNSFIQTSSIEGAALEYSHSGSINSNTLIMYQPNPSFRSGIDLYSMVSNKNVDGKNYTGFLIPASRRYRIKLTSFSPFSFTTAAGHTFASGNVLQHVASFEPDIILSKYGSVNSSVTNFSLFGSQNGILSTTYSGTVGPEVTLESSLLFITNSIEVEGEISAGDFIGFSIYIDPIYPFKLITRPFVDTTRSIFFIKASITQIGD